MEKGASWQAIVHLLSELVVFQSYNFDDFLKKLIQLVLKIVHVDSCLIYFYDRHAKQFILIASKKSHTKLLGKITLKRGEGITGWVAAHQQTVILTKEAYKDERFKFFKELPEDLYEAFLSVPIIDREGVVGVINFQHKTSYRFTKDQITTIEAIVKIIASAFEKIILERKVSSLENKLAERKVIEKAKGILMKVKQMTEDEAYAFIRTEAMKKRKSIKQIAEAAIMLFA
jgi:signal transduction protein with GAF and PtsI domain